MSKNNNLGKSSRNYKDIDALRKIVNDQRKAFAKT